jgi:hypothetical protein
VSYTAHLIWHQLISYLFHLLVEFLHGILLVLSECVIMMQMGNIHPTQNMLALGQLQHTLMHSNTHDGSTLACTTSLISSHNANILGSD